MSDYSFYMLLCGGIFAGAVVSGFVGFAFSAVAGAILLHVMPPAEAVPLMMACSIAIQGASLVALRGSMRWQASLVYIFGGAVGIPPALYLLHHIDTWAFRAGFGMFLVLYSAYMFFRPSAACLRKLQSQFNNVVVGFVGGLVGGLTAMPGAMPTIWCDLRGVAKDEQRGLVQPFIAAMQCVALGLLISGNGFWSQILFDLAIGFPALIAGTALGIFMFRRVEHAAFRRVTLCHSVCRGSRACDVAQRTSVRGAWPRREQDRSSLCEDCCFCPSRKLRPRVTMM